MQEEDLDFQILPELSEEEMKILQEERINRMRLFYDQTGKYAMEKWYPYLTPFTFKSLPFSLTAIEGFLLTLTYSEDQERLNHPQIQQAKKNLIEKVNQFINQHFPNGCFMKLSTRSPKDAGWDYRDQAQQDRHISQIIEYIQKYGQIKCINKELLNLLYRYFLEASKQKLLIRTGEDFFRVFASSERIFIDLNDISELKGFIEFRNGNFQQRNQILTKIWGRQWIDCQWMEEFRCFFFNKRLTAISQYDQRCFFQELQGRQDQIREKVELFYKNMSEGLEKAGLSEGVMDLVVPMERSGELQLIEINVFSSHSRGSLFSWSDRQTLENGPLEVRLVRHQGSVGKQELLRMMGMIQKGIDGLLQRVFQKMGLAAQWEAYGE